LADLSVARPSYQKYEVTAAPSGIDGMGAFAAEPIPARRKIGEARGEAISTETARIRATRHERVMIVEVSPYEALDLRKGHDALRFANHSCAPNARFQIRQGRVEFYALRDIAAGEEITVDYRSTHHEGARLCTCGAPNCKGRL
jgi:SET domain-containing protein